MNTTVLVLDKRIDHYNNYIKPTFKKRFNIDTKIFLVGNGDLDQEYNYIDTNDIPTQYINSTTYGTWFARPSAFNAWKAHRLILEEFLESDEEYSLLLEDDIFVENDFEEIIDKDLDDLTNELKPDILMLGSYGATKHGIPISPNLVVLPRMSGCGGWHAVILSKKVIRRLLEFSPLGPFDEICARFIHGNNNFKCLAVTPSVITQKSGYSYVEGSYLTKPDRSI